MRDRRIGRLVRFGRDAWLVVALVVLVAGAFVAFFQWNRAEVDAKAYWRAGTALRTGAPLYPATATAPLAKAYLYPPAFAAAIAPLTVLPPLWGYAVWMALELVLAVALWRAWQRLAGLDGAAAPARRTALALALLLLGGALASNLAEGQVNLLVALFTVAALVEAEAGRDARAGLLLAAAVHVKLVPIVLVAPFLVWRRTRLVAWVAVGLLAWALLPLPWRIASDGLVGGLAAFARDQRDFVRVILWPAASAHAIAGVEQLHAPNDSLLGTFSRLFGDGVALSVFPALADRRGPLLFALPRPIIAAAAKLIAAALVGIGLFAASRGRSSRSGRIVAAGLLLTAGALAAPTCWEHHLVILAPLGAGLWALVGGDQAAPVTRARAIVVAALVPLALALTLPWLADVASAIAGRPIGADLARSLREYGAATFAVLALFAVASALTTGAGGTASCRPRA